jgi:hypothetical protein
VTQRAADFELVAMVNSTGRQTINVSPLTTIAVKAATCRGAETVAGLNQSWDDMADVLNIGLDAQQLGDPMTQVIDGNNVETAVLANEALGELVRRAANALPNVDADQIVEVLACDIANGSLDGVLASQVTADDSRVFAVMKAAEAAIRVEVLVGRLNVDGSDLTNAMNAAIRTIMPQISLADVNSVPLDSQAIDGALAALVVLAGVIPDAELDQLIELLGSATASSVRSELSQIYNASVENTMTDIADRMAVTNQINIDEVSDRSDEQSNALAPVVSLGAQPTQISTGESSVLSWSSSNAEVCHGSWTSSSIGFESTYNTGALQQSTLFSLVCTGLGGATESTVGVVVDDVPLPEPEPQPEPEPLPDPTVALSTSSQSVAIGSQVTLTWSSAEATSCIASAGWSGEKSLNGLESVGPITANTTFTLNCGNSSCSATSMVSVLALGALQVDWQAPSENEDGTPLASVEAYRIHYGVSPRSYTDVVELSGELTSHSITLPVGNYYVAMTAMSIDGESDLSGEVRLTSR